MKYIRRILTCGFLAAAAAASAQTAERVMGLEELYALADASSKTIRIFETAVTGAGQEISVARNDYLPSIDFSASASYNGNAWVADRDFSNGQIFQSPHFGNSFTVEASQVVFAGGAIHNNVKALEIRKQISEWDLAEHRQQVYFLLTGYYLDLYKYRNLLVVYDRNMEQTMQVIEDMRAREAAGVALDNDITRYEVQYQNLKYKRTELLSSIDIYNDRLVTMLDLPAQTELASAEENVTLDVRAAYIRYLDSFELLRTQEKSLQLARENYEVTANRYANDLVLVTDLVDADNLRLAAEVQYENARINVVYNYYRLLYATGSLDSGKD